MSHYVESESELPGFNPYESMKFMREPHPFIAKVSREGRTLFAEEVEAESVGFAFVAVLLGSTVEELLVFGAMVLNGVLESAVLSSISKF